MIWGISVRTACPKSEAVTYWWYEGYQSEQLVQNLRLWHTDDMRDISQNSLSKIWVWDLLMIWGISEQLVQNLRLGHTDDMRDISQNGLSKIWGWDLMMTRGISVRTACPKSEAGTYWWQEGNQSEQLLQNLRLGLTDDMRDISQNSLSKIWSWDLLMTCGISVSTACPKFEAGT
jgi:hypothetical protein